MKAQTLDSAVGSAAKVAVVLPQSPPQRTVLAFAILCLGSFMAFLDIQIVSASIEEVGGGLSASVDDMSWVQTSYLIGEIIVIPLAAWMSRVMSTRWLLTVAAAGFTLASMLCGMAWDLRSMIVFRAIQGIFGGVMIPTAFTAAVVLFKGKQSAVAASCVSVAPSEVARRRLSTEWKKPSFAAGHQQERHKPMEWLALGGGLPGQPLARASARPLSGVDAAPEDRRSEIIIAARVRAALIHSIFAVALPMPTGPSYRRRLSGGATAHDLLPA